MSPCHVPPHHVASLVYLCSVLCAHPQSSPIVPPRALALPDCHSVQVAWLCLGGFRDHPEGFKCPHDAWFIDNQGTVIDGLYSLVEAVRSQTVAKTLPIWLSRPIASTEVLVKYYDLPRRMLAKLSGCDQVCVYCLL